MSRHQQGNKKLTLTVMLIHLGTTWPPLLSGWKSPGAGIPGMSVIFAENSKMINADKCWQLARQPHFALFWRWTGSTALSGLQVHVLTKMLWPFITSARTTRCRLFLASISFLWRRRRHTFSCLFLNEDHKLSRSHSRQIDLRRQCLHSCDLLPCWRRSKVAGVAY